ncbi:Phosphoribosyl-AMP cyclohydrolase [Candidatus Johnevansia muelleri]|uniref:Phosphoribosyl-AMP cyclohydrolase n=1 Tax=Candidatus Johnevansia muelleri TaxID=1495769 RepID=A0A078KEI5_9GAMM|nr:Phosphoribosyl-AMP cyclohydrolase [Candidatus Evansia muelleri]
MHKNLVSKFTIYFIINYIQWNLYGIIPVITQQYDNSEVLMMAWMNREALLETLGNGRVCYWSRSREKLWRKGELSGQIQLLKYAYLDCDGDSILLKVEQYGPSCHSGRHNCFYMHIYIDGANIVNKPLIENKLLYKNY